ncbi:heat shock protein Hsp-12.2-like [Physella acuta]|uniref:heat shock protein Hsp-12.2-like n=1 Tax=Physella acuta TaxID=109671 RepID=UPI0027DBF9EB|nr:heat shock protein Hsp-12.2-like [Physella acuta]
MFAIHPRLCDENNLLRLVDDLVHPWDVYRSPVLCNADRTHSNNSGRLGDSEIQNTDKEFRIRLDLRHYSPEEVKITSDNKKITIKAKHEEKQDKHGFVSREMIRTYALPDNVDATSVTSTMNSQGTLLIKASKKAIEPPKEIAIPVEFKG